MGQTFHTPGENTTMRRFLIVTAVCLALWLHPSTTKAQFAGKATRDDFRDTSILRPPAGSNVAMIVFEDLGCPSCARAHPYELEAVAKTHVTLVRYDFPLAAHVWTFDGAVCARYIQDKISPKLAADFRTDVFTSQSLISSKEDINKFTSVWLQKHGQKMPAVIDPDGSLAKKVQADYDLGQRLNVEFTPTIVVVTHNEYQAVCGTADGQCDPTKILAVVQGAMAQAK